jgi:hypothetical protein
MLPYVKLKKSGKSSLLLNSTKVNLNEIKGKPETLNEFIGEN